jgi:hypothetical protein
MAVEGGAYALLWRDACDPRLLAGVDPERTVHLFWYGPMEPRWENRVVFGPSRDARGAPVPRFEVRRTREDEAAARGLLEDLRRAAPLVGRPLRGAPPQLLPPGSAQHILGTTRMAAAPREGVVDPDGRAWGFENLYLAGTGVIGGSTSVPPTHRGGAGPAHGGRGGRTSRARRRLRFDSRMTTAADFVARWLKGRDMGEVFELSGGTIGHLLDAFARSDLRVLEMHHEQSAAFAACGLAQMRGRPAVAVAAGGPGALNLVSGIAAAFYDSVPLIAITGQVQSYLRRGDRAVRQWALQETDFHRLIAPVAKAVFTADAPGDVPRV